MKVYKIRDSRGVELLGVFAKSEKQAAIIAARILHRYADELRVCPVNCSIAKRYYYV